MEGSGVVVDDMEIAVELVPTTCLMKVLRVVQFINAQFAIGNAGQEKAGRSLDHENNRRPLLLHTSKGIWMTRCVGIETFAIAADLQDGLLLMTDCMPYGGVQSQIQDKGYKGNFDLRLPVAGRGGQLLETLSQRIYGIWNAELGRIYNCEKWEHAEKDGEDDPKDSSVTLELEVMDVKESYAGWSRIRWKVKLKCKANPLWQQKKLNDICKRNDILLSGYSLGVCGTQ
ncbi:hypothetical protein Tco_0678797 [Tanacetum coccineum]|uniref:Uncharacterized protein n=1 Tax=Tanacetum coccineum TaxID=301880 RepID=A0ABQ4XH06_9ASTR